jgi:spermidine/putrescine transport system permease protein
MEVLCSSLTDSIHDNARQSSEIPRKVPIDRNPDFGTMVVPRKSMAKQPSGFSKINALFGAWTAAVIAFLYLPIVLLVIYSFNKSPLNIVWQGATTKWYVQMLHDPELIPALKHSVELACVTTVFSVLLGTAGAWLSYRYRFPFGRSMLSLIYLPILMPDVIMGVSLLVLFSVIFKTVNPWLIAHHLPGSMQMGFITLLLAHVTFCFPFVMVAVQARLAGLDPALEEAAMDLGATPSQAFMLIVLPYLVPALISGALMAFTLSMDELIVSTFTYGVEWKTLPIVIFGMARVGLKPTLNAVSAIFIVFTAIAMGVGEYLRRGKIEHKWHPEPETK